MRFLFTVTGPIPWNSTGITDAHNHVWIDRVTEGKSSNPVLDDVHAATRELIEYRKAGGGAIIDCQPAGCGRNALRLLQLSRASEVAIISATGFHRPVYYPPEHWLLKTDADRLTRFFIQELQVGEEESLNSETVVKAGFLKIALEETFDKTYQPGLKAAGQAAMQTGRTIEIHTEKGQSAEAVLAFFMNLGLAPDQLVLCHMDKRPDIGLHKELAQCGVTMEYDTFYRSKYDPETNLWPLILRMVEEGMEDHICLATDMAEAASWSTLGSGPGLAALPGEIRTRLLSLNLPENAVRKLTGENICRILSVEYEPE